jgi:Ser/Thr protein kinase RdoA (MazF antagonist)
LTKTERILSRPPFDARPRTALSDLPPEAIGWLHCKLGSDVRLTPVDELVHTNHSFLADAGGAKFLFKLYRRANAADCLQREVAVLRLLKGLPCPELIDHETIDGRLALLLTSWLDALPLRYLDFSGALAADYLPQLGELLAEIHRRLNSGGLTVEACRPRYGCDPVKLWPAAKSLLGRQQAELMLLLLEEAAAWLRTTPWQVIHGDIQDKNFLFSPSGKVLLCDFEAMHYGPLVYDLSVDYFYLKRQLSEPERAHLQERLLEGYGRDPGLDARSAAHLRLLRFCDEIVWRTKQPDMQGERSRLQDRAHLLLQQAMRTAC